MIIYILVIVAFGGWQSTPPYNLNTPAAITTKTSIYQQLLINLISGLILVYLSITYFKVIEIFIYIYKCFFFCNFIHTHTNSMQNPHIYINCSTATFTTATPLDTIKYILFDYWEEAWDPRSRHMSFVSGGPWKMMAAMTFYIYFSAWLGPALMKNRAPFELRRAMLFYNISTVLLNAYFFIMSVYYLRFGLELFNFKFPSRDISVLTEVDFIKARLVYFYILTKLYDLADTIFFVLRKKNNQITGMLKFFSLSVYFFPSPSTPPSLHSSI